MSQKNWSVVSKTMSFLRQRPKSVEITEKSVVAKDLVRCLKNHEFFETTDQVFRANRFCFSVLVTLCIFF
jgi:hypothetical protein